MNEVMLFGIGAMLTCFTIATFFLSHIQADIHSDNYDIKLDPLVGVLVSMLIGGLGVYFFFPDYFDNIKDYGVLDFILPFVFAVIIYFFYMLDVAILTNIVILLCAFGMTFLLPSDFNLFQGYLNDWQNKLAIIFIMFVITKGLSLMNGLGGVGALQFMTVMIVSICLVLLGIAPHILGFVAMAYIGAMLAFLFYSWPPEKLIITTGGFASIGFILACFMLNMSAECAEAPMFIACSYLFTETGVVLYNRYIMNEKEEYSFMNTSYYKLSNYGEHELFIVKGLLKIFVANILFALLQTSSQERIALPVFSVAINFWILSIISGKTSPTEVLSITRTSFRTLSKLLKNNKKDKTKNTESPKGRRSKAKKD